MHLSERVDRRELRLPRSHRASTSFGDVQENNVPGLYDEPFPYENTFGFHFAGMVGHDFFKP
jgi:hypothetical protein